MLNHNFVDRYMNFSMDIDIKKRNEYNDIDIKVSILIFVSKGKKGEQACLKKSRFH